jgi:FMN phosphatase YigB (HAD superfamily)
MTASKIKKATGMTEKRGKKRYKPVLVLDAGGVLVNFSFNNVFIELSERFGLTIGSKPRMDLTVIFRPLEVGEQTWDSIPPALNNALGLSLDSQEWRNLCNSIFIDEVPGMRETLSNLKPEFTIVALSNTIHVHWEFILKRYPIFHLLDGWVVSYKEGVKKPDTAIYRALSNRYCNGRTPFYFTDDTPRNIEAARSLGWDAEVFRDAATFNSQINKRLRTFEPSHPEP